MTETIFYSWQSDLPNATNRTFIEDALGKAAKAISRDDEMNVEPVIDRDTAGVPGSPNIALAILEKIANASVFVCDVSFINPGTDARPTPNPNVLVELGYALRALGDRRIIMVVNEQYGPVKDLPFDLKLNRAVTYTMRAEDQDRAPVRKILEKRLTEALRAIFADLQQAVPVTLSPADAAIAAVNNREDDQVGSVARYMDWLVGRLDGLAPDLFQGGGIVETFMNAIGETIPVVVEFSRVVENIARRDAVEAAAEVYRKFELILERYDHRHNDRSEFWQVDGHVVDYDFFKFLGHELFVTFFSFLIQDGRWSLIGDLLDREFFLTNGLNSPRRLEGFEYASQWVEFVKRHYDRGQARYVAPHGQLLNERHSQGELTLAVPFEQFMAADLFLFLRSPDLNGRTGWTPWSTAYLYEIPRYLVEVERRQNATRLAEALNLPTVDELRDRVSQCQQRHVRIFGYPLRRNALDS